MAWAPAPQDALAKTRGAIHEKKRVIVSCDIVLGLSLSSGHFSFRSLRQSGPSKPLQLQRSQRQRLRHRKTSGVIKGLEALVLVQLQRNIAFIERLLGCPLPYLARNRAR